MIEPAHKDYQEAVREWVVYCFGEKVADDIATRCFRFFEEAGELCQSLGMRKEDALKLVEYTWGRPVGEPVQELGGVMVTLAALATPAQLHMELAGTAELARCWLNSDKIRAKQASKAKLGLGESPLPGCSEAMKFVTLHLALETLMPEAQAGGGFQLVRGWLPQQSIWQIVGEQGNSWLAQNMSHGIMGQYALPKHVCSTPRDKEQA
jgi:hypothetical protein